MDLNLKAEQAFWQTPRNVAILLAANAAVAGTLGYKFGQQPPPPIIINIPPQAASK